MIIKMNLYTILKDLCLCPSVSGRENNIREKLAGLIAPFTDDIKTDALGNLIAKKHGKNEGAKIMLCAHMDEIGFLVTFIEDSGMLRVANVGGIRAAASANSVVVSEKGTLGVLVPQSDVKEYSVDKLYIDLGTKSKKESERKASIGDFFVCRPELIKLAGKRVAGRPIDDRVGCAVLLAIAERFADGNFAGEIDYVFSVQEEVGCRGARPAAFGLAPDFALCFDVTATGDALGDKPMACKVGGGAAVKIKDSSVICHEKVVNDLCSLAEKNKISYQREILLHGGTDTSSIQLAGAGTRAGALSIPTRYIHSSTELCDLSDAEACIDLASEFINEKLK
jgi:endoglucanase